MSSEAVPVSVYILDKEYRLSCTPEEKKALQNAAELVDGKMRELRSRGNAVGTDRLAVVVALNIAHELLQLQSKLDIVQSIDLELGKLESTVERALSAQ